MVYKEAPWIFTGRAIYQLQLVKAEEARKHVPKELKLVEAFGYTLGGFYLARYEDSPVGSFDECVVMAGLVWNPPTSCAWAGRVYVSDKEARDHGLHHVGLPSRFAAFTTADRSHQQQSKSTPSSSSSQQQQQQPGTWWFPRGQPASTSSSSSSSRGVADVVHLFNLERGQRGYSSSSPIVSFQVPSSIPVTGFLGPRLRLALPSFSGGTSEHPALLQYSCDLQTNVMPVTPLKLVLPVEATQAGTSAAAGSGKGAAAADKSSSKQRHPELMDSLLKGRPLVALAFSDMKMTVQEPSRLVVADAESARAPSPATQAVADLAAAAAAGRT